MKNRIHIAFVSILVMSSAISMAKSEFANAPNPVTPAFMTITRATSAPLGYLQFCQVNPGDCSSAGNSDMQGVPATLSPSRWRQLVTINNHVNRNIKPVTDYDLYRISEKWTYPVAEGDCEDYVLLKRRMLMAQGWPENTLLITVVLDQNDEGHAVLTARTDQGDLILDNQFDAILPWQHTPYYYVKRQSYDNPQNWVAIHDNRRRLAALAERTP